MAMFIMYEHTGVMNVMDIERTIFQEAVEELRKNLAPGMLVETDDDADQMITDGAADGRIVVYRRDVAWQYDVIIRKRVTLTNAHRVAKQYGEIREQAVEDALLVTEYVTEGVAKVLREMDVQYIDAAGNADILGNAVRILIEGKKKKNLFPELQRSDPFGWAGVKVIFALLCEEKFLDAAYREIAKQADVALGTVGAVMRELENRGFILRLKGKARLENKKDLLEKWLHAYAEKLYPKLLIGKYELVDEDLIYENRRAEVLLGAETAAYFLHEYLKPALHTLYTEIDARDVVMDVRLRKGNGGNLELRRKFWNFKYDQEKMGIVPPLLIYADLLAVGEPRAVEAAEIIYEQYIDPDFR